MNTGELQLFWRIRESEQAGQEAVSLLMPKSGDETRAEFPTSVSFRTTSPPALSERNRPVDVEWSDDDSDLFMSLLDRVMDLTEEAEMVLDVSDELVQGIVQLVALVRFKQPWDAEHLIGRDLNVLREELDIGDLVAINTRYGFCMAIVVGLDSMDVTCILLDSVEDDQGMVLLTENTVLLVSRMSVVSSVFCESESAEGVVLQ